jgi:hypothetical protein
MKDSKMKILDEAATQSFLEALTAHATMSRQVLAHMLQPTRDINGECKYPDTISISDYRAMYDREGIARRVVHFLPEETWASDPEVFETEDAEDTEFEIAWNELQNRLNLWHYLERVDGVSGIGRYGVLLLGFDDGETLDQPVANINDRGERVGDAEAGLNYVRVFGEPEVQVTDYEKDPTNPRFGMPTYYQIIADSPTNVVEEIPSAARDETKYKVHWHRILHVADNRESSEVCGMPRQQSSFNRLLDIRKLLAGSAEMFWKGGFPGFAFEVNPDLEDATMDTESIREEFVKYSEGLQRYLAVTGVTAKSLAPQVADPESHLMSQLKMITIDQSAPMRIFLGSESGHLASTQDQENFNRRITKRQKKYVIPCIVRPLIERLMAAGVLPAVLEFFVEWPDPNAPTDEDKAKVAKLWTEVMAAYIKNGVDTLVPPLEFLTMFMDMPQEQAEAILEAAMLRLEDMEDEETHTPGREPEPEPDPSQFPPGTEQGVNGKPPKE